MVGVKPQKVERRGSHPNTKAALALARVATQFKPGEIHNPKGNNKSLTQRREEMLNELCPGDKEGRKWHEVLSEAGLLQAQESPYAMNNLQDRLEGKVIEKHALLGGIDLVVRYVEKGEQ
ncbi:hypothetical protein LCGC14_2385720 [marine sediment metagenome]|uniref:Uncharacterized protein n=1 Tax=marine sediment metagenome TaxID=412755 RepID=A0A0F9BZN0_9ZZZZ